MNDDEIAAIETAKQTGIPYASFANKILAMQRSQGLSVMVPEEFARKDFIFPLFIDGNVLAVAMANPTDQALIDQLKQSSGLNIQPFIAAKAELLRAIDESYV